MAGQPGIVVRYNIAPVLQSRIERLEEPPQRHRDDEERHEGSGAPEVERGSGSEGDNSINGQDVSEPKREEAMVRQWRRF